VPARHRAGAVDRALRIAHLTGRMRRRLLIARGLVHQPKLVLLDEPTVGLDPQIRQELWSLIDGLRVTGVTVVMSTHYIEEAERLADEVAVMSQGRIIARGGPDALIAAHAGQLATEYFGPPARLAEIEASAQAAGTATRRTGPSIFVLWSEGMPESLASRLGPGSPRPANLEDVFVLLTDESIG
jgi:lipooligosaccharide transport system ATP-binding protein